ncbi:PREDICTED: uncharacterized protein LOC100631926 isoform X2 [Amphimedon queenslandica]|uniref:SH2 domain-containing protein n=1 Tax=Amphimedon queenslandica TaxID=400682 RepID=A0A1X7TPE5_AMPQE|nr:PREDICTED: uncharacterized protein LOC100631926 isoform X2 [Amphimedon queenslandica]|eukprot:XP_019858439.1 PREDICTED: uncharacterized protein LOC100631926 isoform X2 [Amphimedon queenslandica]
MSYYHGLISSKKAEAILNCSLSNGSFLLRDSQSKPGHFVLSIKYHGKLYHVLVFHEFGQYYLDSSASSDDKFNSLEDLVLFGMSHELRVAGEEVTLLEPVISDTSSTVQILKPYSNGMRNKRDEVEDYDILTDLFASVFGSHCSVLVAVHSYLNFDGSPLSSDASYLVCVVKDNHLKAFFVRTVDLSDKKIIAEKKLTKHFEYDTPSELVLTFLSEQGITCIGFKNKQDMDMFTRHVDRIVQIQQEKSTQQARVRDTGSSSPSRGGQECRREGNTRQLKAEEFDIYNLSPEWDYLLEQAGVTTEMLQEQSTLQFILDRVSEMGGPPKTVQESDKDERLAAIAMDSVLRAETIRAERLADKIKHITLNSPYPLPRKIHPPSCQYSRVCSRYKDILLLRTSLTALAPIRCNCYCSTCAAGKPTVAVSGVPPQQYTLPIGWTQFILRSQTHSLAQKFIGNWHVAFTCVACSSVGEIIRTGSSFSGGRKELVLSPDVKWLKRITRGLTPEHYYDEIERIDYRVTTAFQVFIQPGSYTVTGSSDYKYPLQEKWETTERTHVTYALLIHVQKC